MPFTGEIKWSESSDIERPGATVLDGHPQGDGVDHLAIVVQQVSVGVDAFGWVILDNDRNPIQMRNGYRSSGLACAGVATWLEANPNG